MELVKLLGRCLWLIGKTFVLGIDKALGKVGEPPESVVPKFWMVELVGGPHDGRTVEILDPVPEAFLIEGPFRYTLETDPELDVEQRAVFAP